MEEKEAQLNEAVEILGDLREQDGILNKKILKLKLERNYFLGKLRAIEKIGENNDWQDETGLLNNIRVYFNSLNINKE